MPVTKDVVLDALSSVIDPEIGLNIVELGLIYEVNIEGNNVYVKMTVTAPGCPLMKYMVESAKQAIKRIEGVEKVEVKLVWDPPWTPERMSEEAKRKLGLTK